MKNDKEYQIEQAARAICSLTANQGQCESCGFHADKSCKEFRTALFLYNRGFRQLEEPVKGQWTLQESFGYRYYRCSFCGGWVMQKQPHCFRCNSPMET